MTAERHAEPRTPLQAMIATVVPLASMIAGANTSLPAPAPAWAIPSESRCSIAVVRPRSPASRLWLLASDSMSKPASTKAGSRLASDVKVKPAVVEWRVLEHSRLEVGHGDVRAGQQVAHRAAVAGALDVRVGVVVEGAAANARDARRAAVEQVVGALAENRRLLGHAPIEHDVARRDQGPRGRLVPRLG